MLNIRIIMAYDDFLNEWKTQFPVLEPPELHSLQNGGDYNLDLGVIREEKSKYDQEIASLIIEIDKRKFVSGYLSNILEQQSDNNSGVLMRKRGPPTAPKSSRLFDSAIINTDLSLDDQVPVESFKHTDHSSELSDPAYMETDIDSLISRKNASDDSELSDPGYVTPKGVIEQSRLRDISELSDSNTHSLPSEDSERHDSDVSLENINENFYLHRGRGDSITLNKLERMHSADSGRLQHRRVLFGSQKRSNTITCDGVENIENQGSRLITFKPIKPCDRNLPPRERPSIESKPKPVPLPRVSIGMNDTRSLDGTEPELSGDIIVPPGMCKIGEPTKLSGLLDDGTTSDKGLTPQTSEGLAVKSSKRSRVQDYMNFEIGSVAPPDEASAGKGPPFMQMREKSAQSIHMSPKPSRQAPILMKKPIAKLPDEAKVEDRSGEIIYEEPIPVKPDKIDETSSSDDDAEPVYANLMLMKQQTLSRNRANAGSSLFATMVDQKLNLHRKAAQLSRRFSKLDVSAANKSPSQIRRTLNRNDSGDDTTTSEPEAGDVSWKKRQSMLFATTDEVHSEDDLDVMVPTCADTEKTHMRKYLVTSIVASEQNYLLTLDTLVQYMQTFKNVINTPQSVLSAEDINIIFYKIPELHRIHFDFIKNLQPKLEKWTGEEEIAEHFKILALEECHLATEYLKNYQKAIATIHQCVTDNPQFSLLTQDIKCKGSKEMSSLEELLHKPVVRFQRNTLVLHDLIKYTQTSHPDYDTLQKTKKIAQNFLENFETPVDKSNAENQRYLSKQGLVVEKIRSGSLRKLRQIFLFNDVFICCKQKFIRQKITYDIKWAIALVDLVFLEDRTIAQEERSLEENSKQEAEKLQKKVSDLQNELKQELTRAKLSSESQRTWSFRGHKNNLEKIKKKLYEQECQLMLTSPHLLLKMKSEKFPQAYTLLLTSDYERMSWKETITGLKSKHLIPKTASYVDLNNLVNSLKVPRLMSSGSVDINNFQIEDEALFGSLDVTIHKLFGLKVPTGVYCCMEVDTFGHFCMKAKTNIVPGSTEPQWHENFDIELDGAQQLRILVYRSNVSDETDTLIGKCALELCKGWLRGDFCEEAISIGDSMTLVITLKYRNREQTIKRTPSSVQGGLFGVKISTVTKREGGKIPIIVRACVQEVERRGLEDVGIYRISGLNSEVQRLKKGFEKCRNPITASMLVKEMDINCVTGLLKLYFRELPESLFTDKLYYRFQEGMTLSDPEAKEKFMMTIFKSLPEPNKSTAEFMLEHMIRVAEHEATNKMSLSNIATVFGPTLLRPATIEAVLVSMEQLFTAGARDAMMQTGILFFYLTNWHSKDVLQTQL